MNCQPPEGGGGVINWETKKPTLEMFERWKMKKETSEDSCTSCKLEILYKLPLILQCTLCFARP